MVNFILAVSCLSVSVHSPLIIAFLVSTGQWDLSQLLRQHDFMPAQLHVRLSPPRRSIQLNVAELASFRSTDQPTPCAPYKALFFLRLERPLFDSDLRCEPA